MKERKEIEEVPAGAEEQLLTSVFLLDHIIDSPGACDFNMGEDEWEETCELFQDRDDDFDWTIGHKSSILGDERHSDHSPGLLQNI